MGHSRTPARRDEDAPDTLDFIMRLEAGEITDEEELFEGFQRLIDSGLAWQLQGAYGRQAQRFIDAGFCTPAKRIPKHVH